MSRTKIVIAFLTILLSFIVIPIIYASITYRHVYLDSDKSYQFGSYSDNVLLHAPVEYGEMRESPALFSHSSHADFDCTTCHHTWAESTPIMKCMSSGCHDMAVAESPRDRYDITYFYKAYHDMCMAGCHRDLAQAGKHSGPTNCDGCHPDENYGSVKVNIEPGDALAAGAMWRIIGSHTWRNSGSTQYLLEGGYSIEFKNIAGWTKPSNISVAIHESQNVNETATYTWSNYTYEVTLSPSPSQGGTVSGSGTYNEGDNVTISATPNTGYAFENWTENGTIVSSSSTYSFTIASDRNLTANFGPVESPKVNTPSSIQIPSSSDTGNYTVSWGSSSTSGVSYVLEEATNSSFTSGLITAYEGTNLSASISGKTDGTYYYRVKATKDGYDDSEWRTGSNPVVVDISQACGKPSSITVPSSSDTGNYSIIWGSSSTSGVSYVLEEATNSSFTSSLTTVYEGTSLSTSISGKSDGTFYYRVKAAKDGYDDSEWRVGENAIEVNIEKGSLQVFIDSQEAIQAGAQWRIKGTTTWYESGETVSNIPIGNHIVEFSTVPGWRPEETIPVTVEADETVTATGYYVEQEPGLPGVMMLLLDDE